MIKKDISRRSFIGKTAAGIGLGIAGQAGVVSCQNKASSRDYEILRRNLKVASVDLQHLYPEKSIENRINHIFGRMEKATGFQPDIICLPETFNTSYVGEEKSYGEIAEDEKLGGPVIQRVGEFAVKNQCYVICPIITKNEGKFYNSAVLIDRKGNIAGIYHKAHPVDTEIDEGRGVTPGPLRPPVFQTDFGKIGMQICFDANWFDRWVQLKQDGAEIVFFPSQYPGGRMLNFHAWRNEYYVVSSTGEDARVIDISGINLTTSTFQEGYTWTTLNLEKVNVPTFPGKYHVSEIYKKYGDQVKIRDYWDAGDGTGNGAGHMTIESLDPEVSVKDILLEFEIPTCRAEILESEKIQAKYRT